MIDIWCHSAAEYFQAITEAVKKNGRKMTTSLEKATNAMVVTFPDRHIKIGMNHIRGLGITGKWDKQSFLLPSGNTVTRFSRLDSGKAVAVYTKRFRKAVEAGESK